MSLKKRYVRTLQPRLMRSTKTHLLVNGIVKKNYCLVENPKKGFFISRVEATSKKLKKLKTDPVGTLMGENALA